MNIRKPKPSFARALLLLVVALGPLQAQTVFACAMMDTMVLDECCCEDHKATAGCENPDCGEALQPDGTRCCAHSVEISADPDARPDASISKPVEVRFDEDPPQVLISSSEVPFTPPAVPVIVGLHSAFAATRGGSPTYLITQRLRI